MQHTNQILRMSRTGLSVRDGLLANTWIVRFTYPTGMFTECLIVALFCDRC